MVARRKENEKEHYIDGASKENFKKSEPIGNEKGNSGEEHPKGIGPHGGSYHSDSKQHPGGDVAHHTDQFTGKKSEVFKADKHDLGAQGDSYDRWDRFKDDRQNTPEAKERE